MSRNSDRPVSFHGRPNRRWRRLLRVTRAVEARRLTPELAGAVLRAFSRPRSPAEVALRFFPGPTMIPRQAGKTFLTDLLIHGDGGIVASAQGCISIGPEIARLVGRIGNIPLIVCPGLPRDEVQVVGADGRLLGRITNIGPSEPSQPGPSPPPSGAFHG